MQNIRLFFFLWEKSEFPISCIPHLPAHSLTDIWKSRKSCTVMHMQQCSWKYNPAGQTSRAGISILRWGNHPRFSYALHISPHYLSVCHLPAYLTQYSLVALTLPPLTRKQLPLVSPPVPVAWQRCPKTCLPTCLQLCVCFSLRFSSLAPLLPFTVAADSLSFSILSAATLSLAPPISEL